jgi:predicted nucleic acid-binding Zn ribbon protein
VPGKLGGIKKCAREGCGKPFKPRNNFERYCSEACKKAMERERKRKWKEGQKKVLKQGSMVDV